MLEKIKLKSQCVFYATENLGYYRRLCWTGRDARQARISHNGPLAQSVEQWIFNPLVGRSNRPRPTMFFRSMLFQIKRDNKFNKTVLMKFLSSFTGFLLVALMPVQSFAELERIKMATTTSTENSGLLEVLNPPFEKKHGVKLDVIAVGTGKAIRLGKNGDVDFILVHAPAAERQFVEDGYGIERKAVMHNDFVIIGPVADPVGLMQAADVYEAMTRLVETKYMFVSRGDDSGTHKKEKELWQKINLEPSGEWYLSVGQGMGVVLRIANDKQAYTLTDRGTYLAYKDKIDLQIVYENDETLFNPYHVIMINPAKHPHTKIGLARKYSDFIRGPVGQKLIENFKVNGEILFHPDVIKEALNKSIPDSCIPGLVNGTSREHYSEHEQKQCLALILGNH